MWLGSNTYNYADTTTKYKDESLHEKGGLRVRIILRLYKPSSDKADQFVNIRVQNGPVVLFLQFFGGFE